MLLQPLARAAVPPALAGRATTRWAQRCDRRPLICARVPPASAIADVLALWGRDGWLSAAVVARSCRRRLDPVRRCARRGAHRGHGGAGGLGPTLRRARLATSTGQVVVIAGAHLTPGAVWGEILSDRRRRQRAAGVLVDGTVRDRSTTSAAGAACTPRRKQSSGRTGPAEVDRRRRSGRSVATAIDTGRSWSPMRRDWRVASAPPIVDRGARKRRALYAQAEDPRS